MVAVRNIDLDILPGEFIAILGPSGCGKSTLLGAVAGFTPVSAGEIVMDGEAVRHPSAERGMVFQHHTLFPWKTVLGNTEFGLKLRGVRRVERRERAHDILRSVGLAGFERRYPEQLSGGMQQRVNLARVLVNRPRLLLMDEPFSALDAQTRLQMQELLLELWQELRMTVTFVTHDIDEAIFLSDRVVVFSAHPGRIKAEIPVRLDRPRFTDTLTSPEFMRLKRGCMESIREESESPHRLDRNAHRPSALPACEAAAAPSAP
ncbi:MAG: ABC transporter ATP-binding protein [Verrucomicrobia bacterium]|nr:ABC transporter ATP-binding protein [Verrucomicrobiota bacterium]